MISSELPTWLAWGVAVASILGSIVTAILVIVTYRTANAARLSAEIASREYALARRPLVAVSKMDPCFLSLPDKGFLTLLGTMREARGTPTTVHEIRARLYPRGQDPSEVPFRIVCGYEFLLYGDPVTQTVVFGSLDLATREELDRNTRITGIEVAGCDIKYVFSVDGNAREEWTVHATITYHGDEKVTVYQTMPTVNRIAEDTGEMGFLRRFATWWRDSIDEIKCS